VVKKRWQPASYAAIILCLILGAIWVNYNYLNRLDDNYYRLWFRVNQWLTQGISPYQEIPDSLTRLVNPLPALFFDALFGLFDYPIALAIWQTLLEMTLAGTVYFSLKVFRPSFEGRDYWALVVILITSFPAVHAILAGDLKLVSLFFIATVLFMLSRDMRNGAGFLLSLTLLTPWFSFLFVFGILLWSLWTRRYQIVLSFLASFAFLTIFALVFMPDWPLQWIRVLVMEVNDNQWPVTLANSLAGQIPGLAKPVSLILHIVPGILVVWEYIRSTRKDLRSFVWVCLAIMVYSGWLGLDFTVSDGIVVIPGLIAVTSAWEERWSQSGKLRGWSLLIILSTLSWVPFTLNAVKGSMFTGYGMTGFILVIAWISLSWTRLWTTRSSRLPLEILRDKLGS
jgi:hypothetical protein